MDDPFVDWTLRKRRCMVSKGKRFSIITSDVSGTLTEGATDGNGLSEGGDDVGSSRDAVAAESEKSVRILIRLCFVITSLLSC